MSARSRRLTPRLARLRWPVALLLLFTLYLITVARVLPARVTAVAWPPVKAQIGGWSGLEIDDTGSMVWVLSDRAEWATGRLLRDAAGRLTGVEETGTGPLQAPRGGPIDFRIRDSEGLARAADGSFAVSFEWKHRVWLYPQISGRPSAYPAPARNFSHFRSNRGLEAVAFLADGRLVACREQSDFFAPTDDLWTRPLDTVNWTKGPKIPADGPWSAVGLDLGPDDALYLLERRFFGIGFQTRIRRLTPGDLSGPLTAETVYWAPVGRHGNLEGLGIWRDNAGQLRAVMVSDNNGLWLQRAQLAEVLLPLAP